MTCQCASARAYRRRSLLPATSRLSTNKTGGADGTLQRRSPRSHPQIHAPSHHRLKAHQTGVAYRRGCHHVFPAPIRASSSCVFADVAPSCSAPRMLLTLGLPSGILDASRGLLVAPEPSLELLHLALHAAFPCCRGSRDGICRVCRVRRLGLDN